jgi:hypothetical protein
LSGVCFYALLGARPKCRSAVVKPAGRSFRINAE